jgi:LmbE family N-acetylglucosaminyl deacetylase
MSSLATIVCVHAHPDDEAFFGAGATAHYAALGHRVVLITCTSGQLGFDAQGRSGDAEGHDEAQTKATRAKELQGSAETLGFARVVTLGYDDSGMLGWPQNKNPDAFMNANVDAVARTIASIVDEEDAKVIVTYDENGFYGHPDHVQANVVTRRAIELSTSVDRLYYSVVPEGIITSLVDQAKAQGLSMPAWVLDASTHVSDTLVATTLDVSEYLQTKHDAMAAHATQIDNEDLVEMNEDLFSLLFSTEYYQRAWNRRDTADDKTDLMGGL